MFWEGNDKNSKPEDTAHGQIYNCKKRGLGFGHGFPSFRIGGHGINIDVSRDIRCRRSVGNDEADSFHAYTMCRCC